MILDENYYSYVKFDLPMREFVNVLNDLFRRDKFYISKGHAIRRDVPKALRHVIERAVPVKISDCCLYINEPNGVYPPHIDLTRKCTINLVLNEHPNFHSYFIHDDQTAEIPYVLNQFCMLNTKRVHAVENRSTIDRHLLNIGIPNNEYHEVRQIFLKNNNIGLYEY